MIAPKLLPLAREWIEKSNEKERDYFRGLLVLIDNHYQDWDDRQAKSTREFLSQSASQLASQLKTLYSILKAAVSIITCMRTRRVTGVELQIQKPPEGQGEARAGPRVALAQVLALGRRLRRLGLATPLEGRLSFRRDGGGGAAGNVVEDGGDLLEAYLALQQATDDASSKGQPRTPRPPPTPTRRRRAAHLPPRGAELEPRVRLVHDRAGRPRPDDSVGSGDAPSTPADSPGASARRAARRRSVGFSAKLDRLGEERDSNARWSGRERDWLIDKPCERRAVSKIGPTATVPSTRCSLGRRAAARPSPGTPARSAR